MSRCAHNATNLRLRRNLCVHVLWMNTCQLGHCSARHHAQSRGSTLPGPSTVLSVCSARRQPVELATFDTCVTNRILCSRAPQHSSKTPLYTNIKDTIALLDHKCQTTKGILCASSLVAKFQRQDQPSVRHPRIPACTAAFSAFGSQGLVAFNPSRADQLAMRTFLEPFPDTCS